MRIAIEREAMYASEYPFVDYGCDLTLMAEMEKGVKIERLHEGKHDDAGKPNPEKMEEIEEYLSKMRPKTYDKIPEAFVGKGPNGYMLYDWAFHRTKRAPTVTDQFKNIVQW